MGVRACFCALMGETHTSIHEKHSTSLDRDGDDVNAEHTDTDHSVSVIFL